MAIAEQSAEVVVERHDDIAVVKLNQPQTRNALSLTLSASLLAALDEVEADRSINAIVLAGEGKTFCAGGKLGEMLASGGVDKVGRDAANRDFINAVARLRKSELAVVCALNGVAVGGGVALAMACDIVIAEEDAAYLFAFGRVGATVADAGCSYLLPRIIGHARARHLLLTGARVSAEEGLALGLFAEIAPRGQLMEHALHVARQVVDAAPRAATAASKKILMHAETAEFDACLWYEHYMQTYFLNSDEHQRRVDLLMSSIAQKK